jgi:serine/threonine protein kinase
MIDQSREGAFVPCRNCGKLNARGYVFCPECGIALIETRTIEGGRRCTVNTLLKEQYVIVKNLKSGGMGHIDIGYDYAAREYCVMKYPISLGDPDDHIRVQKLQQEANIVSMLAHPNIVRYKDAFWQGSSFYLVLEYIDGNPMNIVRSSYEPSPEDILRWSKILANTLWYIHSQGMLYRDLKPSNVMLDRYGKLYLIDFGGSQLISATDDIETSASIFTPLYAAPEMVTSNRSDARSDIYSLGATIYYLATGNNPPRASPEALQPQFSHQHPKITYLVQRAMSFNPESRFPSLVEVMSFLEDRMITGAWGTSSRQQMAHREGDPRLILLSESAAKTYRTFPITKIVLTIGRMPESGAPTFYKPDVIVSDQYVSLRPKKQYNPWGHARIITEFDPGSMKHEYYLEDLDSVNQTYLNEQALQQKRKLQNGDIIRLGPHTVFEFRIDISPTTSTSQSP